MKSTEWLNKQLIKVLLFNNWIFQAKYYRECSFGLYNSHPLFDDVRPLGPNQARVGGIHLRPPRNLSSDHPDLSRWLDSAVNGVVYVSFGSVSEEILDPIARSAISLKKVSFHGTLHQIKSMDHVSSWSILDFEWLQR